MMANLTMGSLFDGIGGFPLGAARYGIKTVWASEIEAFPIEVTMRRFPSMAHKGDITKLNGKLLFPVDIICGGSPCQDLSVAGTRAGLVGARSGLFMEQIRIIKEMRTAERERGRTGADIRPRFMAWENVPGAFSSGAPKGEDFRIVLEEILRIHDGSATVPRPFPYPILSNLYDTIEETYQNYEGERALYPREMLRDLLLGLHSMCKGADARFFNGHTNISSSRFLVFCVKGLDNVAQNLRDTLLFNILSYMSDQLLTAGNTVAAIDELYLWLSNPTAVTYIRNCLKRVRKKESALILASQNLEDFDQPGIRELTRPLFAIPTHQFLFNAGSVDKRFYMENLQLEPSEFELIRYPQRGVCLYKCGNERYLLEVHAPSYKEKLFGTAGGR